MMAYFDMTIAVHKEGIYVRDLIDINENKRIKSERKSILDEINKSHSEVRSNNDIKLQNYYKNIIENSTHKNLNILFIYIAIKIINHKFLFL